MYTSEVTARLLVHDMGFPPGLIRVLPLHVPHLMLGCRITLLDANHCPGAVMLLIEVLQDRNGKDLTKPQVILHTGDCRSGQACPCVYHLLLFGSSDSMIYTPGRLSHHV